MIKTYVRVQPDKIKKYWRKSLHGKKMPFDSTSYLVLGFDHDDKGTGYVILCNKFGELWWVNNRDVRVSKISADDVQ